MTRDKRRKETLLLQRSRRRKRAIVLYLVGGLKIGLWRRYVCPHHEFQNCQKIQVEKMKLKGVGNTGL